MSPKNVAARRCLTSAEHDPHFWTSGAAGVCYCSGETGLQEAAARVEGPSLVSCEDREQHRPHYHQGRGQDAFCPGVPARPPVALDRERRILDRLTDLERAGHRARPATALLGRDLIEALVAEGTCPADTRRVVIDASVDEMTVMYVETEATRGLLDVLRATSRAAVRVHQERPAGPPDEQQGTEQPATDSEGNEST